MKRVVVALEMLRALGGGFRHRVRAALTILGIVIGTGSIVLLASLLHGGEQFLVQAEQGLSDSDVIQASADEPPPEQRMKTRRPMDRADAEVVAGAFGANVSVEPQSSFGAQARYRERTKRVRVVSAGPSTMSLHRLAIARGRALDAEDRGARVCVIGHEIWEELARGATSLDGLRLEIDGRLFVVVGVLAKKALLGATDSTDVWDRKVLVPDTTYDAIHAPAHEVQRIAVRTHGDKARARATLRGVLLRRHLGVLDFTLGKDESGGMQTLILTVIRVLLFGTGLLALIASGINIMNVMLVTVSERRREIGLRRAIGATPRSVLLRFLLEAVGLAGTGALLGIAAGAAMAWATSLLARSVLGTWELAVPAWSIAFGAALAVTTGLLFGIVPAWHAAKVSPIDALRSE